MRAPLLLALAALRLLRAAWALTPPAEHDLGTFVLVETDDPEESADTYIQDSSGCFRGFSSGTWDPDVPESTYYGEIMAQRCEVLPNGTLVSVLQWWFHSDAWDAEGMGTVRCTYQTKSGPTATFFAQLRDPVHYPVAELRAGNLPGLCPRTSENLLANGWPGTELGPWTRKYSCVEGCKPGSCAPAMDLCSGGGGRSMTCGDLRSIYKGSACCGLPDKVIEV